MNNIELQRRLDNLLRLGTIAEVDLANAKVKVQSGEILTTWLLWATFRAGTSQSWSPPTIGEQCLILSVSGELTLGVVLIGLYTQNAPSQSADEHLIKFADGAEIGYNHASGHLSVKNCNTAEIHALQSITAKTPNLICTGNVQIDGELSVNGEISTQSSVSAKGEVSGAGIKLSPHTHSGVESGNKKTGGPNG